ncbi:MAG: metal transporter CNNM [Acidimicrobiales bacterium]|jgi:metal transporter CNNM
MDEYAISLLLITLSALFSGLTLGYFTLNTQTLRRQAKFGNVQAKRILPIREKGNQLLTTLLLGNVAVNSILSVYLSSLASGFVAALSATVLIFLFGEIIPQAVLSRHAMKFGSIAAPGMKVLMFLLAPITFPIAWMLDKFLGTEIPSMYSKSEIMEIVSEHEDSEHSPIDEDEERIIHGALQFSHKTVREVMTPKEKVHMFEIQQRLTDNFFKEVTELGFSRYPIYSGSRENIVGILFTKELLTEEDGIAIKDTNEALEDTFLIVQPKEMLDTVLARMLKKKLHMGIVINRKDMFLGVITLEDIIEEIIQQEITDEDDSDDIT